MKLTEKQQIHAAIALFVVVVAAEGAFAYFCWNDRAEAVTKLDKLDVDEKNARQKKEQIPLLKESAKELERIIEQYVEILPREDEVGQDDFVRDIDRFTQGIDILIVKGEALEEEEAAPRRRRGRQKKTENKAIRNFVPHKYRFEMIGSFRGVLEFISRVENHSRFLQFDFIKVGALPQGDRKISSRADDSELANLSENPQKSIVVEISTYTYSKTVADETPEAK